MTHYSILQHLRVLFFFPILYGCTPCEVQECPRDVPSQALELAIGIAENESLIEYTDCTPDNWWDLFEDGQLSSFIETALANNPSLKQAQARIELAAAKANLVRSSLFPHLLWGADVSRQKLSETALIPFVTQNAATAGPASPQLAVPAGQSGIPVYFTQWETELNFSYNFDLWGKNRNTWRAALGEVQATLADEAFARLQLSIAVAQVYLQLQVDYQRREVARRLAELADINVCLIQGRLDNGLDPSMNVQGAQTVLSTAKQSLLQVEGTIAVNENKLRSYLAGQFNEEIYARQFSSIGVPKVPLPSSLPLHLVAHRPDIVAQLWLIESAGRQIDVARAGFYPDFNINALYGYQTIHLHKWFEWPSTFFNIDPAVTLPIFDGGLLESNLRGSQINYTLAVDEYDDLILNAVKEVLDALAVLNTSSQLLEESKNKWLHQDELFRLTAMRSEYSLASDLDLLNSESQMLSVKDQELIALGNALQAVLTLVKAIGGGYEACYIEG